MRLKSRVLATIWCVWLTSGVFAQSPEERLNAAFLNKVFYVNHFCQDANLEFSINGEPKHCHHGVWTLTRILVESIKLNDQGVRFRGERVRSFYNERTGKLEDVRMRDDSIVIDVPVAASLLNDQGVEQVRRAAFISDPSELLAEAGEGAEFLAPGARNVDAKTKDEKLPDGEDVLHVGGDVKPPQPVVDRNPEYSESARQKKIQANVVIRLVIDRNGNPQNVRVVVPAGFDLDENAISAVKLWKFKPATRNGNPVPVLLEVVVHFRLF